MQKTWTQSQKNLVGTTECQSTERKETQKGGKSWNKGFACLAKKKIKIKKKADPDHVKNNHMNRVKVNTVRLRMNATCHILQT